MKKLLKGALSLAIIAAVGVPQINATNNDYRIEIKSYNFSKHTRDGLYGITYTEEDGSYTDRNWPLVELSHAYCQNNYSQTLAMPNIVRQFGVSMGVVYWINPKEDVIYYWNTVTGESGTFAPTKSYGQGYQDGANNPNFDFTFKGAETGSGAITHDWYGNLVHMWNQGMTSWGTTAGTHFVQGYAVYKAATEYGKLIEFIPKLSKMNDVNTDGSARKTYPYYARKIDASTKMLVGSNINDLTNFTYVPETGAPNPNYPADNLDWANNYDYHKANTNYAKQPTDFLTASGNLWGAGLLQGSTTLAPSAYYNGYSTGQVFHVRGNIAFGNMFADGQYTNWYLNYLLWAKNPATAGYYPVANRWTTYNTLITSYNYKPGTSADPWKTEATFRETDPLEYFWNAPGSGTVDFRYPQNYNYSNEAWETSRDFTGTYNWFGTVYDLNYSKYLGTTDANRVKTDMMAIPEVDSIKGTRVIIHNYWLDNDATSTQRNGSIEIQYSYYTGNLPTATTPKFSGEPTRTYSGIGYAFGYNKTDNYNWKFSNTSVSCWNELERVNNNVFALYTHVPGLGFSKYFITAVKPNNAVSNLKVAQSWNRNGDPVHTLTWTPQVYDRGTMHTYEVWYRKKKGSTYEDSKTIGGTSYQNAWMPAGKASVKYTAGLNASGDTIYTSTYEGCKFEFVAPRGDNGDGTKYERTYEYLVIPVYDASAHRGTEASTSIVTAPAPGKVYGNLYQVTEKNENDETLYGFSIRLDPYFLPGAQGSTEAKRLIITSAGGEEGSNKLKDAVSVTLADGTPLTPLNEITFVSNSNGTTTTHRAYALSIDITGKVGADGKLPSIIWHNVNPEWEFKMAAHIESTSTYQYSGTGELATTLYVPEPKLTLPPAGFYKLVGDYGSYTGNEDMPMGSFRRIDPNTNMLDATPTNPVALNNANYYGTNGGALSPIYVTEEVLGALNANGEYENNGWRVGYIINVYDSEGKHVHQSDCNFQTDEGGWATVYSNLNNVMCDIIGLDVDYTTEKGEDGRERKIYNPIPKTYKVEVILEYYRDKDRDGNFFNDDKVLRTTYTELITGTTTLPELGVKSTTNNTVLGALYQRGDSHFYYNNSNDEGYYPFYYDAAMLFNWDEYSLLNRYMGYYGASKAVCYGHYENPEHNPNTWVQYHAGSVLTDAEVESLVSTSGVMALNNGSIGYNSATDNWSALAISNNQVPMNIHYVHGSDTKLSGEEAIASVKFDVTLTAEYPVVSFGNDSFGGFYYAEDPETYSMPRGEMNVMTVPTSLTDMYVNTTSVTTGVEGILTNACGGWQLYPNPVGSFVTIEAPMLINDVKIFTMDGQLVKVVKGVKDTTVKINVEELPQGVYIVNTLGVAKMMIKL